MSLRRASWVVLSFGCGLAVAACSSDEKPSEPSNVDGEDIPVPRNDDTRTPDDTAEPDSSEPDGSQSRDDEPAPISRPPTVVPPEDTTVANGTSPRGGSCSKNADCVPGMTCITTIGNSAAGFVSVAGGYCSNTCASDLDCAPLGDTSHCDKGIFGIPTGFCTLPCDTGAPAADKCNGRTDLVCYGSPGEAGSCNPTCGSPTECEGFGYCGFGTGHCQSMRPDPGTRVGGVCPAGEPVTCSGFCIAETDQDGICTGPCRVGSACGNDPALRCVPADPSYRRGDFGFCEQPCTTSADCSAGIAVCAPTGFVTSGGEPERTCSYALSIPTTLNQRLSVEELALPGMPAGLLGIGAFTPGASVFRLSAGDDGVCVSGTLSSGSPVVLVYQFGSNDAVPFDASAFQGFSIEQSATPTVALQAQLSDHPGLFFQNEVIEGRSFPLADGAVVVPFSEMAPLVAGAATWDPAQLEAVRLAVGVNGESGPFEACVSHLGFE
ncbi:MAG TPA: hypothetical protein VMG12_43170 [Polyangiaceae bacterium]|nr:hypothetical protein [Polyangiaceae bacterium]